MIICILSILFPVILGSQIVRWFRYYLVKKAIRNLRYESICKIGFYVYWPGSRWPNNYYSNFLTGTIKPEFKSKVESLNKELKKLEKHYFFAYIIGFFFIALGFITGFI